MENITERELEIAHLREIKGLSFKEIGARYQISPSRASQIFRVFQRKQRAERQRQLRRAENLKYATVDFTLGEIVVLRRILFIFTIWKVQNERHTISKWCDMAEDSDYVTAKALKERLYEIEKASRKPVE